MDTNNEKKPDDGSDSGSDKNPNELKEQQHKRGGPYTKEEQERRRREVYELHFEHNESASGIAELLGVNRNTINQDLKIIYSQIGQEIGGTDLSLLTVATLHRLELQRARVAAQLENVTEFEEKMRVEGMLYNINVKIAQITSKIVTSGKQLSASFDSRFEEISEEEISELVRDLGFISRKGFVYKEDIEAEYIRKTKCNTAKSNTVMRKMQSLGLEKFKCDTDMNAKDWTRDKYDIVGFANMRGYLTAAEISDIKNKSN